MVQVHGSGGDSEDCTLVSEIAKVRQHLKNSLERVSMIHQQPTTNTQTQTHTHVSLNHESQNNNYKTSHKNLYKNTKPNW